MAQPDRGHTLHAQRLRGGEAPVAGEDGVVVAEQDRRGKPKPTDGRGDLGDLLTRVGASVAPRRFEVREREDFDLQCVEARNGQLSSAELWFIARAPDEEETERGSRALAISNNEEFAPGYLNPLLAAVRNDVAECLGWTTGCKLRLHRFEECGDKEARRGGRAMAIFVIVGSTIGRPAARRLFVRDLTKCCMLARRVSSRSGPRLSVQLVERLLCGGRDQVRPVEHFSRQVERRHRHRARPDGAACRGPAGTEARRDRKDPRASSRLSIGPWSFSSRQGVLRPLSARAARPTTDGVPNGQPPALAVGHSG